MRVLRYEVPVDDEWHTLVVPHGIVHVACRDAGVVEVWAVRGTVVASPREFRVVGTGQEFPPALSTGGHVRYVGTALTPSGMLVWHLLEHVGV